MERDLGILWEWEYDKKFIGLLNSVCQISGKTSYLVSPHNLSESIAKIEAEELQFRVIIDRATDSDPAFMPIIDFHRARRSRIINDPEKAVRASNKAIMHYELMKQGINVPLSLFLSPDEEINDEILDKVGRPFVIKPAEGGGGGEGVIIGANAIDEVRQAQEQAPGQTILIQELIVPRELYGMRCWFRVFHACGKVIPCFWDDQTHVYRRLTPEEEIVFGELRRIAQTIHEIVELEFFSTEIMQTYDQNFVVADYVNDQCDMRFQSDTPDGVPDSVVEEIVEAIVGSL
jgi:glutathione synthase/RimK-type ligase-like ATP-grasp enzyme